MKPASTIQFTSASRSALTNAASNASRLAKSLCGMVKALTPAARARSKAFAPARLEITTLTRAFSVPALMASKIACRLEPSPDTKTPRLIGLGAVIARLSIAQLGGPAPARAPTQRRPPAQKRARSLVAQQLPPWSERFECQRRTLSEHRGAYDLRADRREQDAVSVVTRAQEQAGDCAAAEQRQFILGVGAEVRPSPAQCGAFARCNRSRTAPAVTSRS